MNRSVPVGAGGVYAAAVAPPVATGPDGRCDGRLEFQNMADFDIELGDRIDFKWGDGIRLAKKPNAQTPGGSETQETNPDPHEIFARADPAIPAGTFADLRVWDSRRPSRGA